LKKKKKHQKKRNNNSKKVEAKEEVISASSTTLTQAPIQTLIPINGNENKKTLPKNDETINRDFLRCETMINEPSKPKKIITFSKKAQAIIEE